MAWTLKAGKTFAHNFSEVPISSAYAIVDGFDTLNKSARRASFNLLIYVNRNARVNNKLPVAAFNISATGADFDTYFAPSLPTSVWTQANNYMANGGLASTGLVASDWQVDGQAEP
jgi:hypothetical protein